MATLLTEQTKPISGRLYGLFLEDINRACDGGLNANMIFNPSFCVQRREAVKDKNFYLYRLFRNGKRKKSMKYREIEDPMYGWTFSGNVKAENGKPILQIRDGDKLSNGGFSGIAIEKGKEYALTFTVEKGNYDGKILISFIDEEGQEVTESQTAVAEKRVERTFRGKKKGLATMVLTFFGQGELSFGRFSFFDKDSIDFGGKNPFGGRLRRDLVESLQDLHPAFMRFPGGCIVEGYSLKNAYRWKDTIGKLEERVPKYDLWGEQRGDKTYMQSYEIGFYEYFLLSEYLGAKPLPILNAGMACQARSFEVASTEEREVFCQDILDLIEYANGREGKWAEKRIQSGHPEPFGLSMIGIGNENWGEKYAENFDYIYQKVRMYYPDMEIVFSNGFDCYQAGLGYEKNRKLFDGKYQKLLSDDHFYRSPDWVMHHENLYDGYDRTRYPVFLGEYAANGKQQGILSVNTYLSALSEAVFMTGLERNADIVVMSSYAPLFAKIDDMQWEHNLINFDGFHVLKTTNYHVHRLFTSHIGNVYIPVENVEKGLFVSVTQDEKSTFIKVVNTERKVQYFSLNLNGECEHTYISCEKDTERNQIVNGTLVEKIVPVTEQIIFSGKIILLPRSVNVFVFDRSE